MTALNEYQRLETTGIWRNGASDQRRDVVVSLGDATLIIYDKANRALAHWSLPAVVRRNPGREPAVFAPGLDAPEELEVEDPDMIAAVETIQRTIKRRRPREGRLRGVVYWGGLVGALAAAVFWLPDALIRHGATIIPDATRVMIGQQMLDNLPRLVGAPCSSAEGDQALTRLSQRLLDGGTGQVLVIPGGALHSLHLPGGKILVNRSLVEDFEAPDVVAGYVLVEALRAETSDSIEDLLQHAGPWVALRLLTTGSVPPDALGAYTEDLLRKTPMPVPDSAVISQFRRTRVATTPYAYAEDITGETTLPLIEADPGGGAPVLLDGDWIALQGICGE